jgi:predicted dehydrogenase
LQLKKVLQSSPGQVFMPGHSYIYEPALERAKQMIDDGELGQLCNIAITYVIKHPEDIAKRYPGVIRQILTHHSYILLYLAGAPTSLSCHKSVVTYQEYKEEEQASVILSMPKGAQAYFHASFAADDHGADPWTTVTSLVIIHLLFVE